MIKRVMLAGTLAASTAVFAGGGKMEPDDLPGPPAEVARDGVKVEVPSVPSFDLPVPDTGFHGPRELRVRGRSLLGTEVKVKGYITWIYDCPTALAAANPDVTRAQIIISIENDPTLCERPNFYLGDAKDTSRDSSIWVVEVPRLPTKLERQKLPKDELRAWPAVPRIAVGDYVSVTGTWAQSSPHGDRNIEGLVVYKALDRATATPGSAGTIPTSPATEPDLALVTKPPLRKAVEDTVRNSSVDHLNACNKAQRANQYDAALAECQAALKIWDGNHMAWYAQASSHMARGEWQKARAAIERAVALRPDHAMYQLYYGISLYEAEHQQAREDQARRERKRPEDIVVDPTMMKLDAARDALRRAVKLGPELWRAHYYLGRVYRDIGDARRAAEQFTATISTHPRYRYGYIALIELYRHWDYIEQALSVAKLGTAAVPATDIGELWFELGMAYDAKRDDEHAIEAFGKAIVSNPDDLSSKFQRGQIYFRRGDFASAKRDLEEVAHSSDPRIASTRPLASQMLGQIASKRTDRR